MSDPDYKQLETRGFVHVPSFLSEGELQACREDFAAQPVNSKNDNYGLSPASSKAVEAVKEKMGGVLQKVRANTDLKVDLFMGGAYFATGRGIRFNWHQDHESFFVLQNHYDYLNFYIPITKPIRDKSNLSIIPWDNLQREAPRAFPLLVRGGATRFPRFSRGKRMVFFDDRGSVRILTADMNRMAHTPSLDPGDLLLLRGDMIHQTQDAETERVALSIRMGSASTPVSRARMADGGLYKARMMQRNARTYALYFKAFDEKGQGTLPLIEILQSMVRAETEEPKTVTPKPDRFFRYLLSEKRRAGVLHRFALQAANGILADRALSLVERFRGN